jgi:hypothetical protein
MQPLEITLLDKQVLITSSILAFILPGAFLLCKGYYLHGTCILLSGIGSVTYWYNPTSAIYHMLDLIISRTSTSIFIGTSFYYACQTSIEHVISTIALTTQVIYYYMKSRNAYSNLDETWIVYHAAFHFCCFLSISFTFYLITTGFSVDATAV